MNTTSTKPVETSLCNQDLASFLDRSRSRMPTPNNGRKHKKSRSERETGRAQRLADSLAYASQGQYHPQDAAIVNVTTQAIWALMQPHQPARSPTPEAREDSSPRGGPAELPSGRSYSFNSRRSQTPPPRAPQPVSRLGPARSPSRGRHSRSRSPAMHRNSPRRSPPLPRAQSPPKSANFIRSGHDRGFILPQPLQALASSTGAASSRRSSTRNRRRRRLKRKSRSVEKQPVKHAVNSPLVASNLGSRVEAPSPKLLLPFPINEGKKTHSHLASPSLPPTTPNMSNASPPNIYQRPSMELVREALKLETACNPKATTLIHRINRVRIRYGQAAWEELREVYLTDITYEQTDFSTLRRQFLALYEAWQQEPGGYPSSSSLDLPPPEPDLFDQEGFLPELSLILPTPEIVEPVSSPRRTESLYSDDISGLEPEPAWQFEDEDWPDFLQAPPTHDDEEANRSLVFHRPEMSYYPHQPLFTSNYFRREASRREESTGDDFALGGHYRGSEEFNNEGFSSPASLGGSSPSASQDDAPLGTTHKTTASGSSSPSHTVPSPLDHDVFNRLTSALEHLTTNTLHTPPRPSETLHPPVMASLIADQFNLLLTGMKDALRPTASKPAFKDVKVGVFYPNLPVDQQHPAGRSCVVNGITYYRHPRLLQGEIESLLLLVDPEDVIINLPTILEGAARTWWRDILTKAERETIIKDMTCKLFVTKLIEQFERQDEDPLSTVFENRFTTSRLKAGEDFFSWTMESTAILTAAGLDESRRLKTIYACLDSDLKNEFGPPGNRSMQEYIATIQTKAHVYRAKLLQQDQENRVQQAKVINNLVKVIRDSRGGGSNGPQIQNPVMQPHPQQPSNGPLSITVTSQTPTPFTGRPCRHCGGGHLDNACPSRPAVSRACRFCGQMHMDHSCPQRPAGFKNCSNCGGPHYFSVCPSATKQEPAQTAAPPAFANMQVGQPSNVAQRAVQSAGFVQQPSSSTALTSTANSRWMSPPQDSSRWAPMPTDNHRCGSCQASFPSHQALYGHAIATGHQVDAKHADEAQHVQLIDFGFDDTDSFQDPVQVQMVRFEELSDTDDESSLPTTSSAWSSQVGMVSKPISSNPSPVASVSRFSKATSSSNPCSAPKTSYQPTVSDCSDDDELPSYFPSAPAFVSLALLPERPTLESPTIIPAKYSPSFGRARSNYLEIAIKFKAALTASSFWICLDTGCGISLISAKLLQRCVASGALADIKRIPCAPVPFRGINDKAPSLTRETVQLTYYIPGDCRIINGKVVDHRQRYASFCRVFLIVPDLFCDMILGTDAQIAFGMAIDFHHMALTIHACSNLLTALRVVPKLQAKVQWRIDSPNFPISITPLATMLIPVYHKPLPLGIPLEFVPYLHSEATRALAASGGFHRVLTDHCAYTVLYSNSTTQEIVIPPYLRLGHIQHLDVPASQVCEIEHGPARADFVHRASLTAVASSPEAVAPVARFMPFSQAERMCAAAITIAGPHYEPKDARPNNIPRGGEMPPPLPEPPSTLTPPHLRLPLQPPPPVEIQDDTGILHHEYEVEQVLKKRTHYGVAKLKKNKRKTRRSRALKGKVVEPTPEEDEDTDDEPQQTTRRITRSSHARKGKITDSTPEEDEDTEDDNDE
ncbi:hypothetical protein BJ508DRAFT_302471 [Ascobolus immersus RN42]|uniref:C2H2-type domain-containing protein n=1 Tax=Ascobolus immersus RN42 TaxID=1160509 RepID=A0A3N4IN74_ASCIM|nr:hypothetical protein BJ508DRAFT_302471 [Ascobolus immersus RN42]